MSTAPPVLGINARNALIARCNPRAAVALARDKQATKQRLHRMGIAVPPTLMHVRTVAEAQRSDWRSLPGGWVMKPNAGSRGRGVLIAAERDGSGWRSGGGRSIGPNDVTRHAIDIVLGDHTSADRGDSALVEPLLRPHPSLWELAPIGLPDIRVICVGDRPLMAMMRLPTHASGGRANLHQGGIGAAIDLDTGRVTRARTPRSDVATHPDTGATLRGRQVPAWREVLDAARGCGAATGLGYVGVDLVIDAVLGVLVLEVNAHPGLEIQNVVGEGLGNRLRLRSRDGR